MAKKANRKEELERKPRTRKKIAVTFILNIGVVIVLMFAILGAITFLSVDRYSRQNGYGMASIAMSGVNKELTLKLADLEKLAKSLVALDDVIAFDFQEIERVVYTAASDRSDLIRSIIIASEDGRYLIRGTGDGFKDGVISMPEDYDPTAKKWYQAVRTLQDSIFSPIGVLDTTANLGLVLGVPIRDEKRRVTGVLAFELSLDKIQNIIKVLSLPLDGKGILVTEAGEEIVNQIDQRNLSATQLNKSKIEEIDQIVGQKVGQILMTFEGKQYFASYTKNVQTQYIIIAAFPFDKIMQDAITTMTTLVSLFAVFTLVVLGVIVSRIRKTLRPINPLVNAIRSMHEGNLTARAHVDANNEIGELAENFNEMAESIEVKNIKILRANEELEQKVLERTAELQEKNDQLLRDLKMAQRIQQAIIPQEDQFPQRVEMKFGARYSAMENLGGDLYDIIRIGRNSYGFVMADVSGHGVPAALITTMAKVSFHSHAKWGMSTSEILDNINAEMFRFIGDLEYYLTAFFCILNLETGELHYTNAGHHAGIVYRKKTGAMESLDTKGYFIGSFEDGNYETGSTVLQPGDRILLFTDGIIEARNEEGEFFEYNRLRNYIKTNHSLPPKDFVAGLADNLQSFCGKAPQTDDQAILQVEFVKRLEGGAETEALDIQVRQLSKADEPEESAIIDYAGEYARAIELMKAGSYDEACAALERLLLIKPSDVKVLNNLGVLYYKRKDYEVAKRFLERALIAEPNNASAVKNLRAVEKALVAAG